MEGQVHVKNILALDESLPGPDHAEEDIALKFQIKVAMSGFAPAPFTTFLKVWRMQTLLRKELVLTNFQFLQVNYCIIFSWGLKSIKRMKNGTSKL